MATANTITDAAYRKCGLLLPTSDEDDYGLEALNNMISLWGTEFLVPYLVRENFDLVIGTRNYTIGSGGDFDTVRPMRLDTLHLRDSDDYDYPLKLMSPQEWADIRYKDHSGKPTKVFYKTEYSLGKIRFNKKPDATYKIYLCSWKNFTEFANLTTTVTLPDEYKKALVYNLAVELAEDNSIDIPSSVLRSAANSLVLLTRLIAANRLPSEAKFDFNGGASYNITTDE